jgi:Fic family protein
MPPDQLETPARIEPARLDETPAAIADLVAEIAAASAMLGNALHARTADNLAGLVRLMNTYYSNLIEGHNTRPRDIERALAGDLDADEGRRNLQLEAAAHIRVKAEVDRLAAAGQLPEPASRAFVQWLHAEFYRDAPAAMLQIKGRDRVITMQPGVWRTQPEHDNVVGWHIPPSSARVGDFMRYFEERYSFASLGKAAQIVAIPAAHHRFNYIHPFVDGNGRVSRLMSDVMCLRADIGAHGLWSVSRGLARGLAEGIGGRSEYKRMMDLADTPRQGDLDGRGNLSQRALVTFTEWFLKVCLDQIKFMSGLFDLNTLGRRLSYLVDQSDTLKPEAARLLTEALIRGEFERGEASRITGLPERTARRVLNDVITAGLLGSDTPKGALSLRFPAAVHDVLFPRLFIGIPDA